jgi:hypothetical protein
MYKVLLNHMFISINVTAFVGRNYVFEDSTLLGYDTVSNGTQL